MGRRIIYRIEDRPENVVEEYRWDEVKRLQHWYDSEFTWTAGRLGFKRYVVFPNTNEFGGLDVSLWKIIAKRHQSLVEEGLSELEVVNQLEREKLVVVKWGGYFDDSLASGFTRVADNEWNAFLVCDFLLKASTLCPNATINLSDEGKFIKTGSVRLRNGKALLFRSELAQGIDPSARCFSIVDPQKYDGHPEFRNFVPEFNRLEKKKKREVLRNWNWLGYGDGYDVGGDDKRGFDLNAKVREFVVFE
ncbi:MAG TPA: hypothetical protein DCP63_01200 [Bacteroidetes bacterium]|nr:hypothetical protein [Bacteroidota bacterium]